MSSSLGKSDLIDFLVAEKICNKDNARLFVELFFEEIRKELEQGNNVKLTGFGNFILRDKAERPGRDPKTGRNFPITARRVVTFRAGSKLNEKINQNNV